MEWYHLIGLVMVVMGAISGLVARRYNRPTAFSDFSLAPYAFTFAIGLLLLLSNLILGLIGLLEWYQIIGVALILIGVGTMFADNSRGGSWGCGGAIWQGVAVIFAAEIIAFADTVISGQPFFWQLMIGAAIFYLTIGVGWVAMMGSESGADEGYAREYFSGVGVGVMATPIALGLFLPVALTITLLLMVSPMLAMIVPLVALIFLVAMAGIGG